MTWQVRWVECLGDTEMVDWLMETMGRCSTSKEMFIVLEPPDTEHT